MKIRHLFHLALIGTLLSLPFNSPAQVIGLEDTQSLPIEINADGETRFEDGIAIADNNVSIEFGTTSIYCDKARFNPKTKALQLDGNVRIYQDGQLYIADRAVYNIETKEIDAELLYGAKRPMLFQAASFKTESEEMLRGRDVKVTTHDSAKPDFHWKAKSVRLYPDDRVIFSNVSWYVGKVPILWFPYLYQSLDDAYAFSFSPGYSDTLGAYLLTRYSFPIGEKIAATARVDLMADRGVGLGLDGEYKYGPSNRNWGSFRTYYIEDSDPSISTSSSARTEDIDSSRYRLSLQHRGYFTDDIYTNININKLSDQFVLQDFFEPEFRLDPQPDNVVSITKWDENYTLTATARAQVNDFFQTTSRLPEIALDIRRQPLFDSGLFYESETSVARLERNFADSQNSILGEDGILTLLEDYDANRFDTFHQFTYPMNVGWLSLVPRAGFRFTYYDNTASYDRIPGKTTVDPLTQEKVLGPDQLKLRTGGSETRAVFNLGLEASFKFSGTWDNVQSRALGLDGLRHIVQPYTNISYVSDPNVDPEKILQFDRLIPSTQLNPLDFPQFTAIDSIDQWTVVRLGVRQRLQTRRGDATFNWFELDTFADINIENPYYEDQDVSNLFNNLTFQPVPWASLNIDSQLPVFDDGFTEVNTYINWMASENLDLTIGHRFLDGNPLFEDSSLLTFGLYWKINDHWSFSAYEQYEFDDSTLQSQSYTLHRDLQSWVASLGAVMRDNGDDSSEFALLLSFTLKELPELSLPLNMGGDGSSQ